MDLVHSVHFTGVSDAGGRATLFGLALSEGRTYGTVGPVRVHGYAILAILHCRRLAETLGHCETRSTTHDRRYKPGAVAQMPCLVQPSPAEAFPLG